MQDTKWILEALQDMTFLAVMNGLKDTEGMMRRSEEVAQREINRLNGGSCSAQRDTSCLPLVPRS